MVQSITLFVALPIFLLILTGRGIMQREYIYENGERGLDIVIISTL